MANALTTLRLVLAVPVAVGLARRDLLGPGVIAMLIGVAIASDYLDGPISRRTRKASAIGMLFDHSADCLFVTAGLAGAAVAGAITPVLPALIPFAFGQYVFDSYVWHRKRQLRASFLGRWNGILYFVPLVLIASSRLPFAPDFVSLLQLTTSVFGYLLAASTVVSMVDRAITPLRSRGARTS